MPIKVKPFDAAKLFQTDEAQLDLITDALDTGHPGYIAAALGIVAKARGMAEVASDTGLNRQSLYAALSDQGNPTIDTVMKVLAALGIRLEAKVKPRELA